MVQLHLLQNEMVVKRLNQMEKKNKEKKKEKKKKVKRKIGDECGFGDEIEFKKP